MDPKYYADDEDAYKMKKYFGEIPEKKVKVAKIDETIISQEKEQEGEDDEGLKDEKKKKKKNKKRK